MTDGLVASRFTALFFTALLLLLLALTSPTLAGRPAASELSGTLLSVNASALSIQGSDGRAVSLSITPATWLLKGGLPVTAREFVPGETVQIRRGRTGSALLVCDPDTAAVLDAHRGRPLAGTILSNTPHLLIVQPSDSPVSLPICLTPHTTFSVAGAKVTAAAFGTGTSVTILTRGLSNGLLSAVSVADAAPESGVPDTAPKPRPAYLSGTVLEVRGDLGLLTLQDKTGAARTVAVDARTHIKVRKQPALLTDILPGMHVTGRIGANCDAAGNPVATSLSASDDVPAGKPHR